MLDSLLPVLFILLGIALGLVVMRFDHRGREYMEKRFRRRDEDEDD